MKMDKTSVLGFVIGLVCLIISILLAGRLILFVDAASVFIVIGGTLASILVSYPGSKFIIGISSIKLIFKNKEIDPNKHIEVIYKLAVDARRDGLLGLENSVNDMNDPFLKKGIQLAVDGTDESLLRSILETDLTFVDTRHEEAQGFWEAMAEFAPAWGMIGTLVGLIAMLDQLSDPTTLGPKMAVALITTLYGSLIANLIATPIANKLKIKSEEERLIKLIQLEGILSILAGENPAVIEEKLKSFIPESLRKDIKTRNSREE